MPLIFWGTAIAMLVVATGFVAVPLSGSKPYIGKLRIAVLGLLPMIAIGLYFNLGSPNSVTADDNHRSRNLAEEREASGNRGRGSAGSVASLTKGLEDRLKKEPDDAGGWLLLAKSFDHLGQHEEAIAAYERARSLGKSDAILERSLISKGPGGSVTAVDSAPALQGRVSISPGAAALIRPDDTIFIFARESADQRMPVVALRRPAADLPVDFSLTDKDVMVPGTHLADYERLIVTAKISRSGLATDIVDGLEVWSDPVSPLANERIDLLITATAGASLPTVGRADE